MSTPRGSALGSIGILVGASAFGQILTILRTVYVAGRVGASPELDAALVALTAPNVLANLIVNSAAVVVVPAYIRLTREGRNAAAFATWATLACLALGAFLALSTGLTASLWIPVVGAGLDQSHRELAARMLIVAGPLVGAAAAAALLGGVAQAVERPLVLGAAWALGAAAALVLVVVTWDQIGVFAFAAAPTVSFTVSTIVLAIALAAGGNIRVASLRQSAPELRALAATSLPLAIGVSFGQTHEIVDRAVAGTVGAGAISILRYADQIATAPSRLLVPGFFAGMFPVFARRQPNQADGTEPGDPARTLCRVLEITIPMAMGLAVVAPPLVRLAYGRGAFGAEALSMTTFALSAFAPSIVIAMVSAVAAGIHASAGRTRLLAAAGAAGAVLNVMLDVALAKLMGIAGIALATSVALGTSTSIALLAAARAEPALAWGDVRRSGLRALAAALVGIAPLASITWMTPNDLPFPLVVAELASVPVVGALGYLLFARLFGIETPLEMLRVLVPVLRRRP